MVGSTLLRPAWDSEGPLWTTVTKQAEGNVTSVHEYPKTAYYVRRASRGGLPGCRERTVQKLVQKTVLSLRIPAGVNVSDGDEWFHFQGTSP